MMGVLESHSCWWLSGPTNYGSLLAAAAKLLQSCLTLCDPIDGSPPGSPIPGILQARTLSGLPFPSPMHESEKWKWSHSVVSDSSWSHGLQPIRLLRPWDFPGKSTGWVAIAFSLLTCLHFFRRSLISLIWRGSRKEFLPTLNSYRISGFYQQFATEHRPSCRVNLWYLAFHFPLTRLRPALFSPRTTLGTLIGSWAGLAKTCFPTSCVPTTQFSSFCFVRTWEINACRPQMSRSTGGREWRAAEPSSRAPLLLSGPLGYGCGRTAFLSLTPVSHTWGQSAFSSVSQDLVSTGKAQFAPE